LVYTLPAGSRPSKEQQVLFDARSAVSNLDVTNSEFGMLLDVLPIALFRFLNGLTIPHSVCSNSAEQKFVSDFLSAYSHFLRASKAFDEISMNKAGTLLRPNNFVLFWKIVAYYTLLIAEGHPADEALHASQTRGVDHDGTDCKRVAPQLIADPDFKVAHATAREYRDRVRSLIEELKAKNLFS
jgi:hypothetical protein